MPLDPPLAPVAASRGPRPWPSPVLSHRPQPLARSYSPAAPGPSQRLAVLAGHGLGDGRGRRGGTGRVTFSNRFNAAEVLGGESDDEAVHVPAGGGVDGDAGAASPTRQRAVAAKRPRSPDRPPSKAPAPVRPTTLKAWVAPDDGGGGVGPGAGAGPAVPRAHDQYLVDTAAYSGPVAAASAPRPAWAPPPQPGAGPAQRRDRRAFESGGGSAEDLSSARVIDGAAQLAGAGLSSARAGLLAALGTDGEARLRREAAAALGAGGAATDKASVAKARGKHQITSLLAQARVAELEGLTGAGAGRAAKSKAETARKYGW